MGSGMAISTAETMFQNERFRDNVLDFTEWMLENERFRNAALSFAEWLVSEERFQNVILSMLQTLCCKEETKKILRDLRTQNDIGDGNLSTIENEDNLT